MKVCIDYGVTFFWYATHTECLNIDTIFKFLTLIIFHEGSRRKMIDVINLLFYFTKLSCRDQLHRFLLWERKL